MAEMLQSLTLGSDECEIPSEACSLTLESDECETPCDACYEQGKVSNARKYCRECSEWLCSDCSAMHRSQKITKTHNLIDINKLPKETRLDKQTCEPCSNLDKVINAVMFCEDCDERLCKDCTTVHTSRKMTKSHDLIPINKVKSSSTVSCEPCLLNGITIQSTKFCNICEEALCDKCTTAHISQKATKNHELVGVLDYSRDSKIDKSRCEPCKLNGSDKAASELCMQCEEYLCFNCVKMHKFQKATKSHTIISASDVPSTWCEPCSENDKKVAAKAKCGDCDEALCDACIIHHKSQKATKGHHLREMKLSISNLKTCEPCAQDNKDILATLYCSDCDEFYCESCSKMHGTQKATRTHKLSDARQAQSKKEAVSTTSLQKREATPGKPITSDVFSDSVAMRWARPQTFGESSVYQIGYKEKGKGSWTFYHENPKIESITITGLKANSTYIFQVRVVTGNEEGPYSPESDEIHTKLSMALRLLASSTKVKDGQPSIHRLHLTENVKARNERANSRSFDIGTSAILHKQEKTILLIGIVGSGKRTMIDGIVNYATGVNWKDPYRLSVTDFVNKEATDRTEGITIYTVNCEEGNRLGYRLKIIDTPGFGDPRDLERDQKICKQLKELFSTQDQKGLDSIDAVCFLVKAFDARLAAVTKYMFMSVLALLGQDIENNVGTLITFANDDTPPVLAAMTEAKIPFGLWYVFNNSCLFASNDESKSNLTPIFWDMGNRSFKEFFDSLDHMPTKSLQQTRQVLQERERLELVIQNLQPEIDAGLNKLHQLEQEMEILKKHEADTLDNNDFEYEVEETRQVKTELPMGQHVTNCLTCNITCHAKCPYANDDEKRKCRVMDSNGYCTVCEGRCYWTEHANTPYIFSFETVKVKKTYAEKLKIYKRAGEVKVSHEEAKKRIMLELEDLGESIQEMMEQVNDCNNALKNIGLRPNPLTMVEHIDLMIESEKLEKKDGFLNRIKLLQSYRQKAEIHEDVSKFKEEFKKTTSSRINKARAAENENAESEGKQSKPLVWKAIKKYFE